MAEDESRRRGSTALPPSSLRALGPILIVSGLVLSIAGWTDVLLFYLPPHFGNIEWEFGTIARTFDVMPLPTLGLVLFALGVRVMGGSIFWPRAMSVKFATIAVLCLVAVILFSLDIPPALKAIHAHAATAPQPATPPGLKRGMAKAILFGTSYTFGYAWLSVLMWRTPRPGQTQ